MKKPNAQDVAEFALAAVVSIVVLFLCALVCRADVTDEWLAEQWKKQLRAKYEKDIKTDAGRAKWHGPRVSVAVDTNALTRVARFADATTFIDPWTTVTPAKAAKRKMDALSMRTNGVPARLAAARVLRGQERAQGVSNHVETVTVGKGSGK